MTPPRRADFAYAADYARAVWEQGGPRSPEAVWACTRLAGTYGDLLRAVWGDDEAAFQEWLADLRVEAPARPHIFLERLSRGRRSSPPNPNATLLSVDDVGEVLTAAECAAIIIAEGLVLGRRIHDIANQCGVSIETVRTQSKRMFERLNVSSQAEVAARLSRTAPFRLAQIEHRAFAEPEKLNYRLSRTTPFRAAAMRTGA